MGFPLFSGISQHFPKFEFLSIEKRKFLSKWNLSFHAFTEFTEEDY